jgi:hypothetical protein
MKGIRLTLLLIMSNIIFANAQIQIIESDYTTFDSKVIPVYLIEGQYCVINIDTNIISNNQLEDITTIEKLVKRCDDLYEFYASNLGYEPFGGNSQYSNKCNVFFGQPSCGAGCGLIGWKGIEVSFFDEIFTSIKHSTNENDDVIIGYEFGRNFFTFGNKILLPHPNEGESNGGFAEAFANLMYTLAYDSILKRKEERDLNETLYYYRRLVNEFHAYINELGINPYNSFSRGEYIYNDFSRDFTGSNNGSVVFFGLNSVFATEDFWFGFVNEIRNLPDVSGIESSLSNIALAASRALKNNLTPFFTNVLKFNLKEEIISEISQFPYPEDKLIRDESVLWFNSPFDSISLNIRSTNHQYTGCEYAIYIDGKEFSRNESGNNTLTIDVMGNSLKKKIECQLIKDNEIIDRYETWLVCRHNLNLLEYPEYMFMRIDSYNTSSLINNENTLVISNLDNTNQFGSNYIYRMSLKKEIKYQLSAEIKNHFNIFNEDEPFLSDNSTGWTTIGIRNGVRGNWTAEIGRNIGTNDTINFYNVSLIDFSSNYIPADKDYFMFDIFAHSVGYGNGSFVKNLILNNFTDTDGDGFIDFEDDCPSVYGLNNGCPAITDAKLITDDGFKVYPNPTSNKLFINSNSKGEIIIYNLVGNVMYRHFIDGQKEEIDVSGLVSGTYFLRFNDNITSKVVPFIKN